ncbi:unnamed protein product, partial [Sphagnum troendelagicum]
VATKDFHRDNELGQGGFGVVYKGILLDGTTMAVKLLTTKSHQGIDDFLNEVVSITGVRHKNLVKLKGCCLHRTQRLLVYEYVENKNLAEALWGSQMEDNIFLDWPTRFHILVGIARGLVYLHEDIQPCIIHRDIKASNILLDKDLNAKIADFGLARLFSNDQSQLFTQIAGTIGYMSPEYATLGQLSTKVDVYSFGILLLEIISGRKAILQNATTNIYLVKWAWSLHNTNMLISLVDQKLHNTIVESEMQRVINVALLCVQVETTKRPIMSEVLSMLQGEMDLPNILPNSSQINVSSISVDVSSNEKTFLIQEKTISLIPSVRALHQCFIQQQAFELACRSETVGLAFVAGNPEPLGLGLDQLKGLTEEAEEVAELLNVEAIVHGRVTKEAVIEDLSSACLVVLGTHGVVDPAHTYGALALQGCKPLLSVSQKAASELNGDGSLSLRSARQRLFGRGSLEKAVATASETLTPEEITALPGGVHTGLVVLSACQTGKGEVTIEGVFNLCQETNCGGTLLRRQKKIGVFNEKGHFFSIFFFCGILAIFQLQKGLEGPNISSEQLVKKKKMPTFVTFFDGFATKNNGDMRLFCWFCCEEASYVDNVTGITWMPDDQFIDKNSGVNTNVSSASQYYSDFSEFTTLRYFPDSRAKNCYSFPVTPNETYQIRGTFFYGNYDNQTTVPSFQMGVDGTIVASNIISELYVIAYQEITYVPQRNVTFLCLSRDLTNSVPFISAISLVNVTGASAFEDNLYMRYYYVTQFRWNFGGHGIIRYPGDIVDHYWFPIKSNSSYVQSTAQVEALTATDIVNATFPPEAVMNTALTTNGTMTINIPYTQAYIWFTTLYLAELNPNASNSSREFYVRVPGYNDTLEVNPLFDGGGLGRVLEIEYSGIVPTYVSLFKNQSISTAFGPLVNALEIFELSQNQSAILTNEQDTLAIEEIKSSYGNLGVWTGDPCLPYPHPWVTCSNVSILQNSSSIIAVNLSGYGLTGPMSPSFGKLRSLTSLVLDNNELNGLLPDFSQFPNLNTLSLRSNQFNGPIPPSIWDIPKLNVLDLSNNNLSSNLVPNTSTSCPLSLIMLNLNNNNLNGSFPSTLLDCSNSTLLGINFDHNNFSGTLNMTTWDQVYLIHGVFISMVYNDISTLDPSWEDDTKTYSPILLGGNPICKNLQLNSDFEISYHQQLNCRYNNTVLRSIETVTSNSQRSNNKLILILSTTLSIILVFGGIIGVIILWKYRANALALREIQQEFAKQQVQPTLYSYNVLSRATGDFHQDNKLGEGGFGVVYKGLLLDGTTVAVKLLTTKSHQGIDDFLNEVVSITGVRHKNLVKLKGCCLHRTQRLLVYEYVDNKNLAEALWGSKMEDNIFLDWPTRFHIFVGIARGLVYLHEDLQPCIIHRDIKASNILLDNNLNAKIADFGLARLFSNDQSQLFTQIAGTIGYMSPEYATLGQLSTKVDVYSFGILLLEIISGRKAILQNATSNVYLVEWAWSLHKTNMLISLVDQKLHNTIVESEIQRVINVALLCVQVETTKRPIMSEVLSMLQGEMDLPNILPSSSQLNVSSLFLNVSTSESNHLLSSPIPNNYSNAEVELTNLDPR